MRIFGITTYKGTKYQGWQRQPNAPTIQEEIETRLSKFFDTQITIFASGRTDAGVHAMQQTFTFDIDDQEVDFNKMVYSMNRMLPNDIKILSFSKVSEDFHARFSAKSKTYLYKITVAQKSPFENELSYVYPFPFDYELFIESANLFIGQHDFKDFTSKEEDDWNFIREIYGVRCNQVGNEVSVAFTGNGFMRYQVRNMIGVCLAVASGSEDISFIKEHLKNKQERSIVKYKAPAQGLYLMQIDY